MPAVLDKPQTKAPFTGSYTSDPIHSHFGFAVRYQGTTLYRGSFDGATATLSDENGELALEGSARADAISITNPPQFREHVLGADFFDAEQHPEILFSSDDILLSGDGTATVEGYLTIKGIARTVTARGTYIAPQEDAMGHARGALELETTIDRRDFDFNWNMPLPKGGDALSNEVELSISLQLVEDQ